MAVIEDKDFLRICADLAKCLSISLAAARRKVELSAAQQGVKDLESRKGIAKELLDKARMSLKKDKDPSAQQLDELLVALAEEENFMVED